MQPVEKLVLLVVDGVDESQKAGNSLNDSAKRGRLEIISWYLLITIYLQQNIFSVAKGNDWDPSTSKICLRHI